MPFIVTTHRHLDDPTAEFLPDALPGVSRRAVATLEEARETARIIAWDKPYGQTPTPDVAAAIYGLPESGGTVTLPDGTVIEVKHELWSVLAEDLGVELRWDPPTLDGDYLHDQQRDELAMLLVSWNKWAADGA